jgi:hypothetical protein
MISSGYLSEPTTNAYEPMEISIRITASLAPP